MEFVFKRKINYYETDKMGVVHHSNYIRFLEEARCAWMDNADLSMSKIEKEGFTIPTLEVNVKYKYPVTVDDIILIKLIMEDYNGIKMTVKYVVTEEKTGNTVIEAYTKHCFTNKEIKPINMKKVNIDYYNKFKNL